MNSKAIKAKLDSLFPIHKSAAPNVFELDTFEYYVHEKNGTHAYCVHCNKELSNPTLSWTDFCDCKGTKRHIRKDKLLTKIYWDKAARSAPFNYNLIPQNLWACRIDKGDYKCLNCSIASKCAVDKDMHGIIDEYLQEEAFHIEGE